MAKRTARGKKTGFLSWQVPGFLKVATEAYYPRIADLPMAVRRMLPDPAGQEIFRRIVNFNLECGEKHGDACASAWKVLMTAGWWQDRLTGRYRRPE